ncbi:MAG: tetratricopeptide repeat protein [Acidobacteria bacterium]|nr:tetratricopeptide repeat protein [Acidobacteriota bacterium]
MFTLIFAALLSLQSPPQASPAAEQVGRGYYYFLQGLALESANDVPAAIECYRQASQLLPKSPEIRAALAGLYVRQDQLGEAEREAEAALAIDGANRAAHRILGGLQTSRIENATGPLSAAAVDTAIDHLERAVERGSIDVPVEMALSSLYLRANRSETAIGRLRALLVEMPDYPPALRLLIRAHEATGQAQQAAELRGRLAMARPDRTEIRVRQLERLEQGGRWSDAAAGWAELFDEDPGAVIYRARYAAALVNSGRAQDARRVLLDATRDAPRDAAAWYLLSVVESRVGNAAAAETAAQRVVDLDPRDGRGPLALSRARLAAKNYRGAIQALAPRVAAPTDDDVTSGMFGEMAEELSRAYMLLGDEKRAFDVLEQARTRLPSDEALLFQLAAGYEQHGEYDRAERAFRELIQLNGSHADALNYLGYMLAERGRKLSEAVELVTRALAVDPDNPAFLDSLGWAHFRLGQYEKAREPLERAAAALPQSSVVQEHLGDLYLQLGRPADAAAAFERALAGDRDGIDAGAVTKKRDRARGAAGKS